MAEQQQANALAAAFPSPPPFWQHFTPENLSRIAALRAASTPDGKGGALLDAARARLLDLPPELRFLQPPEPPAEGVYRCFGDIYNLNEELPSLEEQGIEQLYPTPTILEGKHSDRAFILKRIAKSLLLNFLELVGILSVNPEQYEDKIKDLRTLFINFHHLLNEYRPHQARESLILMMQDQLDRSRAETEGILRMKERVESLLDVLGQPKPVEMDVVVEDSAKELELEPEKDIWDELEKEFD